MDININIKKSAINNNATLTERLLLGTLSWRSGSDQARFHVRVRVVFFVLQVVKATQHHSGDGSKHSRRNRGASYGCQTTWSRGRNCAQSSGRGRWWSRRDHSCRGSVTSTHDPSKRSSGSDGLDDAFGTETDRDGSHHSRALANLRRHEKSEVGVVRHLDLDRDVGVARSVVRWLGLHTQRQPWSKDAIGKVLGRRRGGSGGGGSGGRTFGRHSVKQRVSFVFQRRCKIVLACFNKYCKGLCCLLRNLQFLGKNVPISSRVGKTFY